MNVIGIDVSLSRTAVCVRNERGFAIECFESPVASRGVLERIKRYKAFAERIAEFCAGKQPGRVFIEGYSYNSKFQHEAIYGVGTAVRMQLYIDGVLGVATEIAPGSLKKFATGSGSATKARIAGEVGKRWQVTFATNDETDAYVLSRMAACYEGFESPEVQFQRDVIEAIRNPPVKAKKPKKTKA